MEREHYTHLVGYYNEIYGYQYRSAYVIRPDRGQKIVVSDIIQKVPSIHLLGQLFISRMIPHKVVSTNAEVRCYDEHTKTFQSCVCPSSTFSAILSRSSNVMFHMYLLSSNGSSLPSHFLPTKTSTCTFSRRPASLRRKTRLYRFTECTRVSVSKSSTQKILVRLSTFQEKSKSPTIKKRTSAIHFIPTYTLTHFCISYR